jgi:cysteine synthase A
VIVTPAAERGSGMVRRAEELAKKHGWFLARQFENPANPAYHRNTTAPEILRDFAGKRLDYWVTGWGTGGTLTGVGEMLKVARPDVESGRRGTRRGRDAHRQGMEAAQDSGLDPDFIPGVLNKEGR